MSTARAWVCLFSATLFLATTGACAADWQPPKDDLITEKQLTNYLQVQKEALDNWRAAGKVIDGSQSSGAAIALVLRNDEKFKASLASRGMTQDEYSWLGGKVWQAYSGLMLEDMRQKTQADIDQQKKNAQQKLADMKATLANHQKAQKEGRRVITKEEREQIVSSAREEQKSALDEAKQHADEAVAAHKEAEKADADAKAADAAAKNPPSDVSADDRPGFIEQKKNEAQQFRDAAKEARDKEAEARKAETESKTKAAASGKRIADPDLALSDEEKSDFKKRNDEQIASLQNDIKDTEQGLKLLDESGGAVLKAFQQQDGDKAQPKNVELIKKHRAEFEQMWGMKKDAGK